MATPFDILVTGGTGYIGRNLIPALLARGHRVRVLTREQSTKRVLEGATAIIGDALSERSVAASLRPNDTLIHLVGTPHPTPSKADQFEKVDLVSIRASVNAARQVGIEHLVYVSVAHPAPMMQAYLWVRTLGETMIREAGLTATILRPWYVLGPGRRWPLLLLPGYWLMEALPRTRESARRLGLVTLNQMIATMVAAVESPASGLRILEVPDIRTGRV